MQKSLINKRISKVMSPRSLSLKGSPYNTNDFFNKKNLEKFDRKNKYNINNNNNKNHIINIPINSYGSGILSNRYKDKNIINNFNNKIPIKLKRLENNVLMIDTCNVVNNIYDTTKNNNNQKNIFNFKSPISETILNRKSISFSKLLSESRFKSKNESTENSEIIFYNKNLNLIENGELKKLMKNKNRPKTNVNYEKEMAVFASRSRRFSINKDFKLKKNNENKLNLEENMVKIKFDDCIKPKIIKRQHSSIIDNKDFSNDLFVRKLDRITLSKNKKNL
jgi:hypothetical protein